MSRKSGDRFSEEDMRKMIRIERILISIQSGCALSAGRTIEKSPPRGKDAAPTGWHDIGPDAARDNRGRRKENKRHSVLIGQVAPVEHPLQRRPLHRAVRALLAGRVRR